MNGINGQSSLNLLPERREDLLRIFVSIQMIALGGAMYWNEWPGGLIVLILFSLTFLVGALQYATGCSAFRLGTDGFELCNLFRKRSYAWKDVREFRVSRLGPLECVVFSLCEAEPQIQTFTATPTPSVPREFAIPDTYGMSAIAFAALLNERLTAAGTRTMP